ncbi:hypothetical protein QVD17_38488 [Tagetes erecta]|uniref:Uncharacterized protein n=1 Tax=Tagetes erecta TaxID=13708 RepID=A0AAD8NEB4_TARER|nr:hypothetical protein QVD17_38488 [Tagetes erecta]
MDRTEEDMKLIGFFGIFNNSIKTIFSRKKLFTQITLSFILPLTLIFFLHTTISRHFFRRIINTTSPYNSNDSGHSKPLDWLYYALFTFTYFIFLTIFSILSTASVVFTVASIYTSRDVTFHNVVKIIPKIWKRLLITFVFIYLAQFIYDAIVSIVLAICDAIFGNSYLTILIMLIFLIIFILGFLYLTVVCQLASVVTVLENVNGFKAITKGKVLLNGKKAVGMGIAFILCAILVAIFVVYAQFVVLGDDVNLLMIWRVLIGVLCVVLVMVMFLLVIVSQTVLYLVCKSYHREAIDKLSLSTFLGAYMGETVVYPGPGEEIQLGRPQRPVEQV